MTMINLSSRDYRRISEIAKLTHDVGVLKRAQALLWLSDGDNAYEVADRLLAAPRTIYRWVERFEAHGNLPLLDRLADEPRSGRPNTVAQQLDPLIEHLLEEGPENHGYAATVWTAPLLRQHLKNLHHLEASQRSVSRALERLELSWKRPRHCLVRRSLRWRQAKGGSSVGLPRAHARSS
jgi:putative transposase